MDSEIALALLQDGIVSGSIYAILGMALIMSFTVTRVVLFFEGEFISFSALTFIGLATGNVPRMIGVLAVICVIAAISDLARGWRELDRRRICWILATDITYPPALYALVVAIVPSKPGLLVCAALTIAIMVPLAPAIYRIAFQPIAKAPVLVLLMVSMGVHMILIGAGLFAFGPEGSRGPGLISGHIAVGGQVIAAHSLAVVLTTLVVGAALWLFFRFTLLGLALKASAINRTGARLSGISTAYAGRLVFALSAALGSLTGILISPSSTIFYDSGFLLGLKGFVAAILGGMASYPVALGAAAFVGITEGFSAFFASAFKEVIVLTIILPALLWLSRRPGHASDEA